MRLKGKRAVFRQILPGDPLEAQICHFELANHQFEAKMLHFEAKMKHFEAKMKHFEAKTDHFEPKIAHFEAKIVHFATKTAAPKHLDLLRRQNVQNESRIFLMNSLCGLKANGPFSAKSCPGTRWKLKFAILSLQITILKLK